MSKVLQFFCLFAQKFTENTTAKERKFPLRQLSPKQVYPMAIFPLLLFCRQLSHFGFPLTFKPSYNGHRTNRLNLPQWGGVGGYSPNTSTFCKKKDTQVTA